MSRRTFKSIAEVTRNIQNTEPQREGRPNNYYPFWNLKPGEQATVRLLPDKNEDNPFDFYVEKLTHTLIINGEQKTVPCLKMYGEECPICKVSSSFYKSKDEISGKKYWRKKQHVIQALILEDPLPPEQDTGENHTGKVRFLSLGYQLYSIIREAMESGELDVVPYAYEGGYNFIIKKTQQGDYPTYTVGSKFARKPTDLTDEEIEFVEEHMVDLATLLPARPDIDKVNEMLEAALTGAEYQDENTSRSSAAVSEEDERVIDSLINNVMKTRRTPIKEETEEAPPWEDSPKTKPSTKKPASVAKADNDDDDDDDDEFDEDALLEQLRNRSKK